MLAANTSQEAWLETFRQLLHHHLEPLQSTPAVNVGSLVAVAVGLFLVFRGGKFERFLVCAFALVLGGWLGHYLSVLIDVPGPITIAISGIVFSVVAYKSYRAWLAAGSVIVLFGLAVIFQLGRGDLERYLPTASNQKVVDDKVTLPSKEVQLKNLYPEWKEQMSNVGEKAMAQLREFKISGWLIPVAAAIVGGLLAYWALRAFAIVWIGFLGSGMAVLGGSTVLCANWPDFRDSLFTNPQYPAAIIVGLWLLGLIWQAKEARFPKKTARESDGDASKS
ncbi:MAG: hypothetical protein MI923_15765 [Phycisphaerales bacterium]|nr:hypothetical protein [Phycisphaerales bacterium]